jgi:hypothetical protein
VLGQARGETDQGRRNMRHASILPTAGWARGVVGIATGPDTRVAAVTDFVADERAMLERMLDVQRSGMAEALSGLDDTAARARLVPSLTTPLGLVKHATFVEKVWFHHRVAGVERAEVGIPDTVDESFVLEPDDTIGSVTAAYLAACDHSRAVATTHDLDEQFPWHQGPVSLRFVYVHMIAELARHLGHLDILAEQLQASGAAGSATG